MTDFALPNTPYPDGTVVFAYDATGYPSGFPGNNPPGAPVAEATTKEGTVKFSGLEDNVPYIAAAKVSGKWVYRRFIPNAEDPASLHPVVERITDKGPQGDPGDDGTDGKDGLNGEIVRQDLPWVDLRHPKFGYVSGAANNAPALNAAIASLPQAEGDKNSGGRIILPQEPIFCTEPINCANLRGIRLEGEGGPFPSNSINEQYRWSSASLVYTGSGPRFIDARSTKSFSMQGIGVAYTSEEFTGILVDFGHSEKGESDSTYARIRDCIIHGVGLKEGKYITTAKALVSLNQCIFAEIENTSFFHAQAAIRGVEESGKSVTYSNIVRIVNCLFEYCPNGIVNPGTTWLIEGNTVEGLQGASPSPLLHFVIDDITNKVFGPPGLTIRGNWCGDAFGEQIWILINPREALIIESNQFSGGIGSIKFVNTDKELGVSIGGGAVIRANNCSTKNGFGIDLGNPETENINWNGLEVVANGLAVAYTVENGAILHIPSQSQDRDISIHSNHTTNTPPFTQPYFLPKSAFRIAGVLEHTGTKLGLLGSAPISKPTVTGAKAGNEALKSLLEKLAELGLIKNSTT